jgi:hypothetical protein
MAGKMSFFCCAERDRLAAIQAEKVEALQAELKAHTEAGNEYYARECARELLVEESLNRLIHKHPKESK